MVDAWQVANRIDRLIWKNRAMVRITLAAADSRQFHRGVEQARTSERRGADRGLAPDRRRACQVNDQKDLATATYQSAAEAAGAITQEGLRGVMVGFLVDSLIASGRFDDARACTVLYPEESERFVALGAVAESMGKRGLGVEARQWIAAEAPPGYRSALYRRVAAGVLYTVEQSRSKDMPLAARRNNRRVPHTLSADVLRLFGPPDNPPAAVGSIARADREASLRRARSLVRSRSGEEGAVTSLDVPDAGVHDVEVGGDDEQPAAEVLHSDCVIGPA